MCGAIGAATRLEHRERRVAVVLEIYVGLAHRIGMRHLADQIEDEVASLDARFDRRGIAYVVDDQLDAVAHVVDVEAVAAVAGNHRVDHGDVGAIRDEASHDVRTDEAEATGNEGATAGERSAKVAAHRAIFLSTISSHQSLPSPTATWPTRRRLKNCERPCRRW